MTDKKDPSQLYVKLKDGGTVFHDISQDATVVGDRVVPVKKTPKVALSMKAGLLVEVSESDYNAYLKKAEAGKTVAQPLENANTLAADNANEEKKDVKKDDGKEEPKTKKEIAEILKKEYKINLTENEIKNTPLPELQEMLDKAEKDAKK